jgi:hypothetical protein
MKLADIKQNQGKVNIDLKVIYDQMKESEYQGRRSKTVVVVDADAEQGGQSALLDLFDDDIDKYKFQDKIRVVNGYAKIIDTKRGKQPLINYGYAGKELVGKYEAIE